MKRVLLVAVLSVFALNTASAVEPPKSDPRIVALGQMLQESQQREAMALVRAITAEQRVAELEAADKAKAVPVPENEH